MGLVAKLNEILNAAVRKDTEERDAKVREITLPIQDNIYCKKKLRLHTAICRDL